MGDGSVSVQSMTNIPVKDVAATLSQINALKNAGCDVVRIAVPDMQSVAAFAEVRKFVDMPLDYWDSQIALNLNAAAYCARYAVADMVEKKTEGRIVNISSVHGQVTWVHRRMLPYSAGKGGLNMFTKALGVEVAKYGIRVNCVAPGLIFTKLAERYSKEDIVPMIQFLADVEKTRFIVGQVICVDGGQSCDGSIESMNFPLAFRC